MINRLVLLSLNESILISSKSIVYDWDPNKNLLFVTGLSGAGKSTISEKLSIEYQHIQLDDFWYLLYGNKYDNVKDNELPVSIFENFHNKMFEYIKKLSKDKDKKYIIEGVQILHLYSFFKDKFLDFIKDFPIIFINSSVLKSGIRGIKRYFNNNRNWPEAVPGPLYHYTKGNYDVHKVFEKFKNDRSKLAKTTNSLDSLDIEKSNHKISLNESWIISDDDFYYNFDDWLQDKNKILFIIGLSGSGKTTLGNHLANKYNGVLISIDDIWMPILREYKKKTGKKTPEMTEDEFAKIDDIVEERIKLLLKSKFKNKTIIEGMYMSYDNPKEQSIIIKGSSYFRSFYQALQRDYDNFAKKGVSRFLDHYWHYLKMSKRHQHMVDNLKNYLKG